MFGWHQRSDPRLLQRNDPFGVNHWVGGAVGVVRDAKGGVPKWDELLKCKCDIGWLLGICFWREAPETAVGADRRAGKRGLETLTDELDQAGDYVPIPDYAYDCHTPQGRGMGRTKADFFKAEQEALSPFIPGLFDNLIDS